MRKSRKSVLSGLAVAASATALVMGTAGTAAATPVVTQQLGSCVWSADVVHLGGVPMDGYGIQWYVKTGRNDNTDAHCSFEAQATFGMKDGGNRTINFGSDKPAHDQIFAAGPARILQVGLKLCVDGQGCSDWKFENSVWNQ
ncbi:hypothetical protein [Nocardia jinanensis]|uniref:Secreted protein n=1 Tax=Nocardia jinanensis TaxID=382504 RepID=A0A917VWK8_9NOCA|nr:hypothetical protein [Nocardia jinanensis]GGL21617.1 hypothetical protein GCM10011588_40670 [Nocardia jinanensis]